MTPRTNNRSEEDTSALQSHRDLLSFPTRRSSDLRYGGSGERPGQCWRHERDPPSLSKGCNHDDAQNEQQIGRGHVCTPVTPRSTLFPYTTLFRSALRRIRRETRPVLAARAGSTIPEQRLQPR